ncbi:MAG: hypothetical protein WAN81_19910, partial [Candidatus Binataceae bacterium]
PKAGNPKGEVKRKAAFPFATSCGNHPGPPLEKDGFFLCVSRFVFRRKVEDSASLPESSTFPIDD